MVAALWAGSLWTIGFVVAPALFRMLERRQAGDVAGQLFMIEAWIGVACAVALVATRDRAQESQRAVIALVLAMLACIVVGYFGVQPIMSSLRAQPPGADAAWWQSFGLWHAVSTAFYAVESVLALVLVVRLR
jgi:hypothetical protein